MSRRQSLDHLRGIAIICVVVMHSTLTYVQTEAAILFDSFVHNLTTVGVPTFLFLAGFFMMPPRWDSFWHFISEKFERVYLPAAVCTVGFAVGVSLTGHVRVFDLRLIVMNLLTLSDPYPYYFVFVLMLLYGIGYWLLAQSDDALRRVAYLSGVVLLINVAAYELAIWRAGPGELSALWMYRNPLVWAFFFVYGTYVARTDPDMTSGCFALVRKYKWVACGLMVGAWVLTSLETYALFWKLAPGAQDYFKIATVAYTILALHRLLLFCQRTVIAPRLASTLQLLSRYSFFIFLTHVPAVPKLLGEPALTQLGQVRLLSIAVGAGLSLLLPVLAGAAIQWVVPRPSVWRLIGLPDAAPGRAELNARTTLTRVLRP